MLHICILLVIFVYYILIHGNMNIKFNVSEQYCWTSGAKSLFKHKYNKRALFFLYCKYILITKKVFISFFIW